ncbi:putative transcription factor AP2-EREBP family [Medicago truncatula]|uniref:Putative transcription factor AP2-EREBP family n=1 Tax=Medicago truncatula TaxID=3880 RepID=A0A396ICN2_MEDTR|nr:putative transcription factor AP2-EREBP family [Medicago truncatula]
MKSSLDESSYVENNSSSSEILLASEQPKKRAGRRKFKETRHPVYRGVRRRNNNNNKWVCEVRVPNDKSTRIWLGTYPTPEMAARAHDVAALALRGKSACLNFADSAWRLALPATNNAKEIRKMAAEAALAFAVVADRTVCGSSRGGNVA